MPGPNALYLIRHGAAQEQGPSWPDDAERPLTDDGLDRVQKAARGLVRLGATFDVVLTSPFVRARQTAEVMAGEFDQRPPIVVAESLTPTGSFQAVLTDLERYAKRSAIALVGHEPSIGEIAARLAGLNRPLEFKKGAVCRIDVKALSPSGPGTLAWFATARMLGAVRRA